MSDEQAKSSQQINTSSSIEPSETSQPEQVHQSIEPHLAEVAQVQLIVSPQNEEQNHNDSIDEENEMNNYLDAMILLRNAEFLENGPPQNNDELNENDIDVNVTENANQGGEEEEDGDFDQEDDIDADYEIDYLNEIDNDDLDIDDEDEDDIVDDDDDDDDDNIDEDENFRNFRLLMAVRNDTDDYETVQRPLQINFDTALSAAHNYLGENFEDVANGHNVNTHGQEDILRILILQLPDQVQLMPGQEMPINIYTAVQINLINELLAHANQNGPIIGFLLRTDMDTEQDKIGILAEILSTKNEENDPNSGLVGLMLKVRGRDRFRVCEQLYGLQRGYTYTNVKIMPEYVLGKCPLVQNAQKRTDHLFDNYFNQNQKKRPLLAKIESLNNTPNPAWLYRQYDCTYVMNLILSELNDSYDQTQLPASHTLPTDPILFSNWLLNNFPFDNNLRFNVLKLDCINQRLRYIYSVFKHYSSVNCRVCRTEICKKSDIFSMNTRGFMSAYVNPNGHIHETLTVYKAKNLNLIGFPSTQFSWFPGYAWTIVQCKRCNSHIGWKFTVEKNKNLIPDKFWGLTRKSVCHTNDSFDSTTTRSIVSAASSVRNGAISENDEQNWLPII